MRKINIPKKFLIEKYVNEGMTAQEIADDFGCSRQTIDNKLNEYKIERKTNLFKPKKKKGRVVKSIPPYKVKDKFQKAYKELKSLDLVAERFKINVSTAVKWKNKHGIETIKQTSARGAERRMEGKPWYDKKLLSSMYEEYSTYELSAIWGCSVSTVQKWLARHDIPRKSHEEQWKRKPKGKTRELHFNDGKFNLTAYKNAYYADRPLNKRMLSRIKGVVRECQSCGEKDVLDLHHIDENSKNNSPSNHVILCPNCHARIHRLGKTVEELVPNFISWDKMIETEYADAK